MDFEEHLSRIIQKSVECYYLKYYVDLGWWHINKYNNRDCIVFSNYRLLNPVYHPEERVISVWRTLKFKKQTKKAIISEWDYLSTIKIVEGHPTNCKVYSNTAKLFEFDITSSKVNVLILFDFCEFCDIEFEFDADVTVELNYKNLPTVFKSDFVHGLPILLKQHGKTQLYMCGGIGIPFEN